MRSAAMLISVCALCTVATLGQTRTTKTLDIYVIDVEGGNAQLYVTPSGEVLVYTTGFWTRSPGGWVAL